MTCCRKKNLASCPREKYCHAAGFAVSDGPRAMKQFLSIGAATLLTANALAATNNNTSREINRLLASMSIEEKIGQMVQVDLSILAVPKSSPIRLDPAKLREALVTWRIGSIINNGVD